MMPSVDHCISNPPEMTTLTKTLEVFDTYKHREDKDSDEESFHLPLDDDDSETKSQETSKNGIETEDEVLNKFENTLNTGEQIDLELEERLLKEDEASLHQENDNSQKSDKEIITNGHGLNEECEKKKGKEIKNIKEDQDKNTEDEEVENLEEKNKKEEAIDSEKDDDQKTDSDKQKPDEAESEKVDITKEKKDDVPEMHEKESVSEEEKSEEPSEEEEKASPEHPSEERKEEDEKLDKCENSNDNEDLFDISVIRDAEEDNAENVFNGAQRQQEESQSDEQMDDEGGNEKESNGEEEEEMDIDKNEEHLKNDEVDIEEDNLRLHCDASRDVSSDGESDKDAKANQVQNEDKGSSKSAQTLTDLHLDEVTGNFVDSDKTIDISEDTSSSSSLKRLLSEDLESGLAKKPRTELDAAVTAPKEKLPLQNLLSLSEFMKNKKHKRMTMYDLEEFCVQKICEVIVHKGELGEVHQQLKMQEHLIDTMRKEIALLTKQARDLEIVNRKLLNDLKQQSTNPRPLNPLKITRSVGLQVKFVPYELGAKRRHSPAITNKVPPIPSIKSPRLAPASTPAASKQVSPQKAVVTIPKAATPLLTQALQHQQQNRNAKVTTPQPAVRAKPPESKTPTASVIDLTDEDEKKDKNKLSPKVVSKNIAVPLRTAGVRVNTQGIRLTTSQGGPVVTSAPQLMYVVQSSQPNVLTSGLGPKAVVVNFQPTNGILTSALNGSAVSVIPKQSNTIQLKTVAAPKPLPAPAKIVKPNKHPAPLPTPPVIRVTSEKLLKAIPPKPHLTIRKTDSGIILQWKMPYELDMYETIASYQLYAYQETTATPNTDMWRKVGDVKALALPMACTLTQFADKNKYYFAVRPVDIHKRIGMFSDPEEISL